jgi:enoyl-CoA hydratase
VKLFLENLCLSWQHASKMLECSCLSFATESRTPMTITLEQLLEQSYQTLLVSQSSRVVIIQLNRPEVLNAINPELMAELDTVLGHLETLDTVGCIVLTGNEKAFAAGADIKAMANASATEMQTSNPLACWDILNSIQKPVIAAVNGYALGGGFELAMACDVIVASNTATFGLPEITLGVIPGAGGTQRLTRAVGKAKAMALILTGRTIKAGEALDMGLINQAVLPEDVLSTALAMAATIAERPAMAVKTAKQCILKAFETSLEDGLQFERQQFYALFDTRDQKEGMQAFIEKRQPIWQHR